MRDAPAATARRATSAFVVSTLTGMPSEPRSRSSTGMTRASSSSTDTEAAALAVDGARRAGRLSADVDDVRALRLEGQRLPDRGVHVAREAVAGEGVRRHVDNAHDEGAAAPLEALPTDVHCPLNGTPAGHCTPSAE